MLDRRRFLLLSAQAVGAAFSASLLEGAVREWALPEARIALQPLIPFDGWALRDAGRSLEEVFGYDVVINEPMPVPERAKDPRRGRYQAPAIAYTLGPGLTMAITSVDICEPNNNIPDWGVIGVAMPGGPGSVVSTRRVRKRSWLPIIAVHEAGHLKGYDHCDNPACQMFDVRGKADLYDGMRYGWFCEKH